MFELGRKSLILINERLDLDMKRRFVYIILTIVCFILCVLIVKLFSRDLFIRGLIGDFLIVIMIYCLIKSIIDYKPLTVAMVTLLSAFFTELLQYMEIIKYVGLEQSEIAKLIIGSTFDPSDMVAYTLGVVVVYFIDRIIVTRAVKVY